MSVRSTVHAVASATCEDYGQSIRSVVTFVALSIGIAYATGQVARDIFEYLRSGAWLPIKRKSAPAPAPAPAVSVQPLALPPARPAASTDLSALTVKQLRKLARGIKGAHLMRKDQLLEVLC